jgi:hypothetical protein
MFDEFDPFNHQGNELDSLSNDNGQYDDLQDHLDGTDAPEFDNGNTDQSLEHLEDLGELTPSEPELPNLQEMEIPDDNSGLSPDLGDITFGDSVDASW